MWQHVCLNLPLPPATCSSFTYTIRAPSPRLLTMSLQASCLQLECSGLSKMFVLLSVQITFGRSNLHYTTGSITEIPAVEGCRWGGGGGEPQVTLHLDVQQYLQVWGNTCTHYQLTQHCGNLRCVLFSLLLFFFFFFLSWGTQTECGQPKQQSMTQRKCSCALLHVMSWKIAYNIKCYKN